MFELLWYGQHYKNKYLLKVKKLITIEFENVTLEVKDRNLLIKVNQLDINIKK